MKRILSIVLLLLTLAPATMMQAQTEQNKPQARRERPQSGMQTQRLARQMAQQLKLSGDTATWFTQLYTEYQDTLRAVRFRMPRTQGKRAVQMSAEAAKAQIEALLTANERAAAIKRSYATRFAEQLTPQQVLKVLTFNPQQQMLQRQINPRQGFAPMGGQGMPGMPGEEHNFKAGDDKFQLLHPATVPHAQFEHASKIGMGSLNYELRRLIIEEGEGE